MIAALSVVCLVLLVYALRLIRVWQLRREIAKRGKLREGIITVLVGGSPAERNERAREIARANGGYIECSANGFDMDALFYSGYPLGEVLIIRDVAQWNPMIKQHLYALSRNTLYRSKRGGEAPQYVKPPHVIVSASTAPDYDRPWIRVVRIEEPRKDVTCWVLVLLAFAVLFTQSGCTALRPNGIGAELKHDSGLLVDGRDSQGLLREDSLDVANVYLYWNRGNWYAEAGIGYKLREGGFFVQGAPFVGDVRIGRRWGF